MHTGIWSSSAFNPIAHSNVTIWHTKHPSSDLLLARNITS
jgi:hypothetical protein